MSAIDWNKYSVVVLKEELKFRGLSIAGDKAELVQRLIDGEGTGSEAAKLSDMQENSETTQEGESANAAYEVTPDASIAKQLVENEKAAPEDLVAEVKDNASDVNESVTKDEGCSTSAGIKTCNTSNADCHDKEENDTAETEQISTEDATEDGAEKEIPENRKEVDEMADELEWTELDKELELFVSELEKETLVTPPVPPAEAEGCTVKSETEASNQHTGETTNVDIKAVEDLETILKNHDHALKLIGTIAREMEFSASSGLPSNAETANNTATQQQDREDTMVQVDTQTRIFLKNISIGDLHSMPLIQVLHQAESFSICLSKHPVDCVASKKRKRKAHGIIDLIFRSPMLANGIAVNLRKFYNENGRSISVIHPASEESKLEFNLPWKVKKQPATPSHMLKKLIISNLPKSATLECLKKELPEAISIYRHPQDESLDCSGIAVCVVPKAFENTARQKYSQIVLREGSEEYKLKVFSFLSYKCFRMWQTTVKLKNLSETYTRRGHQVPESVTSMLLKYKEQYTSLSGQLKAKINNSAKNSSDSAKAGKKRKHSGTVGQATNPAAKRPAKVGKPTFRSKRGGRGGRGKPWVNPGPAGTQYSSRELRAGITTAPVGAPSRINNSGDIMIDRVGDRGRGRGRGIARGHGSRNRLNRRRRQQMREQRQSGPLNPNQLSQPRYSGNFNAGDMRQGPYSLPGNQTDVLSNISTILSDFTQQFKQIQPHLQKSPHSLVSSQRRGNQRSERRQSHRDAGVSQCESLYDTFPTNNFTSGRFNKTNEFLGQPGQTGLVAGDGYGRSDNRIVEHRYNGPVDTVQPAGHLSTSPVWHFENYGGNDPFYSPSQTNQFLGGGFGEDNSLYPHGQPFEPNSEGGGHIATGGRAGSHRKHFGHRNYRRNQTEQAKRSFSRGSPYA